jgi:hypothetical protein
MRLFLFALLFAAMSFAQPKWASIATPGDAYQYFLYAGERRIETDFSAKSPHPAPEFSYQFVNGRTTRSVCRLKDRSDVYWYSPDGRHLDGTFAVSNPTEFNVSSLQKGIQGFGATARFSGSAEHLGALEVLYFTDRVCSDAGVEYGFSRDLATNSILVYWSTYANCANDAASLCRKSNNAAVGDTFANVQQENGSARAEHGFRLYGLDVNAAYTYKISIERQAFRIEVWDGKKLAQCSGSENSSRVPCTFLRRVQPWFPIDRIQSGYVVTGTQNSDGSDVAKDSVFKVSDVLVLK